MLGTNPINSMKNLTLVCGALALLFSTTAFSEHHEDVDTQSVFHASFLGNLERANGKVLSLAEAFSEEQYGWRPAEGIRSVKDSILHMASANYFIASQLGSAIPEGINPRELESEIEGKANAIATLTASIAFVTEAIEGIDEEDLATEIKMFGNDMPKMAAVLVVGAHANEHLGQLIAYARSTGVVPPWSQ